MPVRDPRAPGLSRHVTRRDFLRLAVGGTGVLLLSAAAPPAAPAAAAPGIPQAAPFSPGRSISLAQPSPSSSGPASSRPPTPS